MIIPQHKEALLRYQREQHRRERPHLDEQAWTDISSKLQRSMMDREAITLNLYDPFERRTITGIVVDIDMIGQRIRIKEGDERYWIAADDILGVIN
ncbi:YolD-like family protein [Paenibacillus dendritiformis]|nr:YolD-like family protein [Paenibacillus dendritiformis]